MQQFVTNCVAMDSDAVAVKLYHPVWIEIILYNSFYIASQNGLYACQAFFSAIPHPQCRVFTEANACASLDVKSSCDVCSLITQPESSHQASVPQGCIYI